MREEDFKPVFKSSNEAREYFKNKKLTYNDIDEKVFLLLCIYLVEEIRASNKMGETSVDTMRLETKYDFVEDKDGKMKRAETFVKSHYFKNRECIRFDDDGFIGFAGWADKYNLNPIYRAFKRWCDMLQSKKVDRAFRNWCANFRLEEGRK